MGNLRSRAEVACPRMVLCMGEAYKYRVYGLGLWSNRPLPGLVPTDAGLPCDVRVDLTLEEDRPPAADVERLSSGMEAVSEADGGAHYHLWFSGDGRLDFRIDSEGTRIAATWTLSVIEEVTALLLGPILGCVLRLRGVLCLHACAVKVGGRAIVMVGDSGMGKSTLAAAFARQGYPVLCDDIAALDDRDRHWSVLPGYPRLRLWPEAVQALYGSENDLARIFSFTRKRFMDLTADGGAGWRFHDQPLPLAALYVLKAREPGLPRPIIEHLRPISAVKALMARRAAGHLRLASERQAREFSGLGRVAMEAPTRHVICHDGLDRLPQLCEAILEDASALGP